MWYLKRNYRYAKVNYKCGIQPYLTCTLRCKTRFQYKAAATDFSNPSLALALFSTIKTIKEKKNWERVYHVVTEKIMQLFLTLFQCMHTLLLNHSGGWLLCRWFVWLHSQQKKSSLTLLWTRADLSTVFPSHAAVVKVYSSILVPLFLFLFVAPNQAVH